MEMDNMEEEDQQEFIFPSKDMSVLAEQKKKALRERARLKRTSMGYDSNSDTDISTSSKSMAKDEQNYGEVAQSGRSETSIISNSSVHSRRSVSRRTPNVVATDHRARSARSVNLHSELRKVGGADGDRQRQSPSFHALERKLNQYSNELPIRPMSSHEFHHGDNSLSCEIEDRPSTARSLNRGFEFSSSECTPRINKSDQKSARGVSSFTSIDTIIPEEDSTIIPEEDSTIIHEEVSTIVPEEDPAIFSEEDSTIIPEEDDDDVLIFEHGGTAIKDCEELPEWMNTMIQDEEEPISFEDENGEWNNDCIQENVGKNECVVNGEGDSDEESDSTVVKIIKSKTSKEYLSNSSTESNTESEKLLVPEMEELLSQENRSEGHVSEKSDSSEDGIQIRPQTPTVKSETKSILQYPSKADYGICSGAGSVRTTISRHSYGAKVNNSQDTQKVDRTTYDAILKMFTVQESQNYDEYYNGCTSFMKKALDEKANITDKFYTMKCNEDDIVYSLAPNHIIDNLEVFALHPVPPGFIVKCRITRNRRGIDKNFFPIYYLHLERDDGRKNLLMVARKRKKSTTSNYMITTDPSNLSKESDAVVGSCRSNILGTNFSVFDGLMSYKHFKFHERIFTNSAVLCQYREELAVVLYETNILGFKGPRKMDIVIPKMISASARMEVRPDRKQDTIMEKVKRNDMDQLQMLKNKTPIWNTENQSFVLNFHGRVTHASVKNFQLVNKDSDGYCGLQFGRVAQDIFHLDFGFPMCPLQAFAIVLSSFDSKLACE